MSDGLDGQQEESVALRKESVDRNNYTAEKHSLMPWSLSARRAWIEISRESLALLRHAVALRKESVDRNVTVWPS